MTIDEAIKNLTAIIDTPPSGVTGVFLATIELGIEALKQIKVDRQNRLPFPGVLLPGETKD